MQKVAPKDQGGINHWLKIIVPVGRKPNSRTQTVVFAFSTSPMIFPDAGFIKAVRYKERKLILDSAILYFCPGLLTICDFGCPAIEVEKCARMPLKSDPRSE